MGGERVQYASAKATAFVNAYDYFHSVQPQTFVLKLVPRG